MTTMFQTFAGLFIPMGFGLFVWAYSLFQQPNSSLNPNLVAILGIVFFLLGFVFLWQALRNIGGDERDAIVEKEYRKQDRENIQTLVTSMGTLIQEVRGLRQDLKIQKQIEDKKS